MNKSFKKGSRVVVASQAQASLLGLEHQKLYTVGAVVPLPNPGEWYVDPYYWNDSKWAWATRKTREGIAGHPQVVFINGVMRDTRFNIPEMTPDPEKAGRRSYSGAWFRPATASEVNHHAKSIL